MYIDRNNVTYTHGAASGSTQPTQPTQPTSGDQPVSGDTPPTPPTSRDVPPTPPTSPDVQPTQPTNPTSPDVTPTVPDVPTSSPDVTPTVPDIEPEPTITPAPDTGVISETISGLTGTTTFSLELTGSVTPVQDTDTSPRGIAAYGNVFPLTRKVNTFAGITEDN